MGRRRVGVLALQGAFAAHAEVLTRLGAEAVEVRVPGDLRGLCSLVMPGGESTTMSKLLDSSGLFAALDERFRGGFPVFGTCAGLILLASRVLDGRPDQRSFSALDVTVRRNAYGRQVDSFEADLEVSGLDHAFPAVFIRAPLITEYGSGVEVLASLDQQAVLVRQGAVMAASFHPELTGDGGLHQLFLSEI